MEREIMMHLYDVGRFGNMVDIGDFLLEKYPKADITMLRHISETLQYLRNQKLIDVNGPEYRSLGRMVTNIDAPFGSGIEELYDLECVKIRKQKKDRGFEGLLIKILPEGRMQVEEWISDDEKTALNAKLAESQIKVNNLESEVAKLRLVKKPNWKERNWLLIAFLAWVIGIATDIGREAIKHRLWPDKAELKSQTPEKSDTFLLRK